MSENIKLQKYIADCGVMSRRAAEKEIAAGHVTVNGVPASLGDRVDPDTARVKISGRDVVNRARGHTYIMLNKPPRVLTTMKDERGRRTVADLVSDVPTRVYPIGRLDMYSDGLLIMTDDGMLANALCHPSGNKEKVYRVTLRGEVDDSTLSSLGSPMTIKEADGRDYELAPCEVALIFRSGERTVIEMTLHEGRNRQIRRMCDTLGLKISRLTRIAEGGVTLGSLPIGAWRYLTEEEINALLRFSR